MLPLGLYGCPQDFGSCRVFRAVLNSIKDFEDISLRFENVLKVFDDRLTLKAFMNALGASRRLENYKLNFQLLHHVVKYLGKFESPNNLHPWSNDELLISIMNIAVPLGDVTVGWKIQ